MRVSLKYDLWEEFLFLWNVRLEVGKKEKDNHNIRSNALPTSQVSY